MSIRALNVVTMHRFSPGSITSGAPRISNAGLNSQRSEWQNASAFPPKPANKSSLLLRASNLLQANNRKSNLPRMSRVSVGNRMSSTLRNVKQQSMVSGRDSTFDANLSVEEEDSIPGIVGMSVHRCSMIKKYSIETFFSPAKHHRRAVTVETTPLQPVSGRANFHPVGNSHPSTNDQSVSQPYQPPSK